MYKLTKNSLLAVAIGLSAPYAQAMQQDKSDATMYYYMHYPDLVSYWSTDPEHPEYKLDGMLAKDHDAQLKPHQQHQNIGRGAEVFKGILPDLLAQEVRKDPYAGRWPGLTQTLDKRIILENGKECYGEAIAVVTYWLEKKAMEDAGY